MTEINKRTVLFLSEIGHVPRAEKFIAEHPDLNTDGYMLVALDSIIELELARKGIPFISGRGFRTRDTEPMVLAEKWATRIFTHTQWSFFAYRGVSFARVYFFPLQIHLAGVLYYTDIIAGVFETHPSLRRCILFAFGDAVPVRGSSLLGQDYAVFAVAAGSVARAFGKEVLMIGDTPQATPMLHSVTFKVKRGLFSLALKVLNTLVVAVRRPKKVRILAYDYWRNIAPILSVAPSFEVLMLERMEAFAAGFKNIFNYRMGFLQLDSYVTRESARRKEAKTLFAQRWEELNKSFDFSFATFRGVSHAELLRGALEVCVNDAIYRSLRTVDTTFALLRRVKPEVIVLRISSSFLQPQFPILAQVARATGISALEIQHGLNYYGPGTPSKFHNAEYLGVYGQLSASELTSSGSGIGTTAVIIGSPRFDSYNSTVSRSRERNPEDPLSVMVMAPSPCLGTQLDTYDVEEFFETIAVAIKKIGGMTVTIKLRPGTDDQLFYRPLITKVFEGVPHSVVDAPSLAELLTQSDIAVSCYSTAALEAMICGVPLINLALSPAEAMMSKYHFAQYAATGAMEIAYTEEQFETALRRLAADPEMRAELRSKSEVFLKKNFLFDGSASQRVVALIESLSKSRPPY